MVVVSLDGSLAGVLEDEGSNDEEGRGEEAGVSSGMLSRFLKKNFYTN